MRKRLLLRMVLAYILFGVISFVFLSTFTVHYNERYLINQKASDLRKESYTIATEYAGNYFSGNTTLDSFQHDLSTLSSYLNADIYIIDPDGTILLNSMSAADPDNLETITDFNILDFGNTYYNIGDFYGRYDADVLSVYTAVTSHYQTVSYVIICQPLSYVSDTQYDLLNGSYFTLIFLMLFSLVIMFIYIMTIYLPLNHVVEAAIAYDNGELIALKEISRKDEIGQLARTVDYMGRELSTLEEDQRKFISNISHDFRSPLTSIKGYAQAMADGTIPPELQEKYLNIIVFESERLEKLTRSLLDLNKLSAKGSFLDSSDFNLNELIRRTVLTFEGRCLEKRISIELILTGEKLYVKADASKIDQVLHNLIDNAIKFSNDDSKIVVETTIKKEKVFISVKDFGIGIPKDSVGKIWDRFYKTDQSRGKDKKGTGLGLAIVREIIGAHHENINVISTEGVGTEFIFTLPLSSDEL